MILAFLSVDDLSDVVWNKEAFDQLVFDSDQKISYLCPIQNHT